MSTPAIVEQLSGPERRALATRFRLPRDATIKQLEAAARAEAHELRERIALDRRRRAVKPIAQRAAVGVVRSLHPQQCEDQWAAYLLAVITGGELLPGWSMDEIGPIFVGADWPEARDG